MSGSGAGQQRVLIVDNDARVRRALADLVNATDGFTVAAVGRTQHAKPASAFDANVAIVGLRSATDRDALKYLRALAAQMPVVAVSAAGSVAVAACRAGAAAFCEMDGNTDALIDALTLACESRS